MPLWTRSVRASRILARLQDERGIALIMAIGIMFVLTITVSSVMVYTAASAGHANNSNAGQKAYALAEAGVNNALAVLNTKYPDTTHLPGQLVPAPAAIAPAASLRSGTRRSRMTPCGAVHEHPTPRGRMRREVWGGIARQRNWACG